MNLPRRRLPGYVALLCVGALFLAACGGGDGGSSDKDDDTPAPTSSRTSPPASPADKAKAIATVLVPGDIPTWTSTGTARTYDGNDLEHVVISCVGTPDADNYATADVVGARLLGPGNDKVPTLNVTSRVRFSERTSDAERNLAFFRSSEFSSCARDNLPRLLGRIATTPTTASGGIGLDDGKAAVTTTTATVDVSTQTSSATAPDNDTKTVAWHTVSTVKSNSTTTENFLDVFAFQEGRAEVYLTVSRDKVTPAVNVERQLLELLRKHVRSTLGGYADKPAPDANSTSGSSSSTSVAPSSSTTTAR